MNFNHSFLVSTSSSSILLSFFFLLLSSHINVEALRIQLPPNVTVPAVFGYGDSIIDPGNNNNITTLVKCNFPPYGKDFETTIPTGRFSNGKIPTDFLVNELGVKEYLPAYLDPSLKPEELLSGVSYASGASGYDPVTSTVASAIPLSQQLEYLKETIEKMTAMVGEERTNFIISNAVHLIVAGSDDIANTYFDVPIVRKNYDADGYTTLMLNYATSFIQDLYKQGARRIGVFGAPPMGCVPSQRTLAGGIIRVCNETYNSAAKLFNRKLDARLNSLTESLPSSRIIYIDIYSPLLDLIQNGSRYGFEVTDKGCCGTGLLEVSILCNKLDPVCPDDTKYLFWDSYHPTQSGYQHLTEGIAEKYTPRFF